MKEQIQSLLRETLRTLIDEGKIPGYDLENLGLSIPSNKEFGDFASNAAMVMASLAKRKPRDIAAVIKERMDPLTDVFERIEIAGPGFINFTVSPRMWVAVLGEVLEAGERFGTSAYGRGEKVQVEFVSANPTGPLHVGHGRGAAVGDTLARILRAAGFDVESEYYINDVGNQMNMLGLSVLSRYRELHGVEAAFPENGYKGDYIRDIANALKGARGDALLSMGEDEAVAECRRYAADAILNGIREDLELFNVHFHNWFSESTLYRDNKVADMLAFLSEHDLSYEDDSALWFRTTRFGDEKDRVLRKQDGSLTYFAPDIAYHKDKLDRGFKKVIDIWGADHHGYVPRMRAAIEGLGAPKEAFHALLIQLVSLVRQGQPVQMSTRSGEFVTLREILDEVGKDVCRYFFMMRKSDAQLVFDLDLAKKKSDENPVYYIQYAHARICSILKNAREQGLEPDLSRLEPDLLAKGDDLDLIKMIASYPDVVVSCASDLEPHRIAYYLLDLATAFHRFYNRNRVISDDAGLTMARLILISSVKQVLANALALMGISAPESM
ncbi:MAG TPA: arginine--tRNA ligase [Deltaproteobacteria bacterium]|nr:arginine--tRNA ligase [Deltaproteobacteria bacterium]HOI05859.1 arginine--tRNA ligase [Deltaproteobacteria bacterium]